jgi:hypothetical protein
MQREHDVAVNELEAVGSIEALHAAEFARACAA